MTPPSESDLLLTQRILRRRGRRLERVDRALRGPAAGLRRKPAAEPRRRRGRRPGDLHRLLDEPAELRRQPPPGDLPVFDRRAQVDRPLAPRGPAAHAAARARPGRIEQLRSGRAGAGRQQHLSQQRTTPDRGTSPRRGDRRAAAALARAGRLAEIECAELLFVRGWPNKQVAAALDISEQAVANTKFDFLARLRTAIRSQLLPRDVFPELYEVE